MLRLIRVIWRSLILISHIVLGCLLVPVSRERDSNGELRVRPNVIAWWHGRLMRILNFQIVSTGQVPAGPALLISNHVSWVDIPLLGYSASARFLSKDDVREWPVIGWLASSTGTLFIKRGGGQTEAVTAAINEQLQSGKILTLFPEGTTTDGKDVRPFFPRLFAVVVDTEIPVVPVTIRYHIDGAHDPVAPFIGEQSLGENLLNLLGRKVNQVHLHFAEPLGHQDGEGRKALAERARNAIVNSLNMMIHQRIQ